MGDVGRFQWPPPAEGDDPPPRDCRPLATSAVGSDSGSGAERRGSDHGDDWDRRLRAYAVYQYQQRLAESEAHHEEDQRLRRREEDKGKTRSARVGPDEPHHHDERVSGPMSPLLNFVYHKGVAKGYLLGATAGSKGAHTGPVITDGDAFWKAYCGLDGRMKGSVEYNRNTVRKAIKNLFQKGKGKRSGHKDSRQGKGKAVNYGGQGKGKGGHEKGGQGKGQIAAAQ